MAATVGEQRDWLSGQLDRIEPAIGLAFSLLIVERALGACTAVFPDALPVSNVPYALIDEALDQLWSATPTSWPLTDLASAADAWIPVRSDGSLTVETGSQAAHCIGSSTRTLASIKPFDRTGVQAAAWRIWDRIPTFYFVPKLYPDYTVRFRDTTLDPATNGALIEEFTAERADLSVLREASWSEFQQRRETNRRAGHRMGQQVAGYWLGRSTRD